MQMRLDRLLTLYYMSPWLRLLSGKGYSIPILMYHSISDQLEPGVHPYYRTATKPAPFAAQLKHLRAEGYASCSLEQALSQLQAEPSDHTKLVVITFDDGYRDFYHHAFPVLDQYGFSATVFLPTAYIAESPALFKGTECLTWTEVRELSTHGILFGSHTVTHPQLRELSRAALNQELANSKKTIEDKLGCAVESFAYPYAFPQADTDFTKMLRDLLHQAGYQNGVCTIVGRANRNSEPLFMERLPVNSCDDGDLFGAKLAGAYDWISKFQYVSKTIKARLRSSVGANRNAFKDFPLVQ
jgi:peptidoglycan/xylan/chitin deacetylase (PgdA/CDA1 family)